LKVCKETAKYAVSDRGAVLKKDGSCEKGDALQGLRRGKIFHRDSSFGEKSLFLSEGAILTGPLPEKIIFRKTFREKSLFSKKTIFLPLWKGERRE